jgi:hypothetical protein
MRFAYTKRMLLFLRTRYSRMTAQQLTDAFNQKFNLHKSEIAVRTALNRRGITCGRDGGHLPGTYYPVITKSEAIYIKKYYRRYSIQDLTDRLNENFGNVRIPQQLKSYTSNHKILSGRSGCFEKGITPWNKGLRGYMGRNRTSFRKGNKPPNRRPMWSERIDDEGYTYKKTRKRKEESHSTFTLKHRWIWERKHGKIPPGYKLIFINGDRGDCRLSNLRMVSEAEMLRANKIGYGEVQPEIKPPLMTLAQLQVQISKRSRGKHG